MNWKFLLRWFALFGLGSSVPVEAVVSPESTVVFDNAPAGEAYWFSEGSVVAPSRVELEDGKVPVSGDRWFSPGNSLRLAWTSARGGDWRVGIRVPGRYGRTFDFAGDALSLQLWAERPVPASAAPRMYLLDADNHGTPTVSLWPGLGDLPGGRWVRVVVPFSEFTDLFRWTDDVKFNPRRLAKLVILQGLDDGEARVVHVDDVRVIDRARVDTDAPAPPMAVRVTGGERHLDVAWDAVQGDDVLAYRVYRSIAGAPWVAVGDRLAATSSRYVDFLGEPGRSAAYRVTTLDASGNESAPTASAEGVTRPMDDGLLLEMVQEACFRYYWEASHPGCGLAVEILPGDPDLVSTGASGFGILALIVATERGWVTRTEAVARLLKVIRFLAVADRFHGAWPHFLDGRSGRTRAQFGKYDNGGDLVETAFLIQGLLAARQYFAAETAEEREIRSTVTRLWGEVEWDWYRREAGGEVLYWHWSPDAGFHVSHPLIGWNETLIAYLLAIASPTHPVPASLYHTGWAGQSERAVRYRRGWSRTTDGDRFTNGNTYHGIRLEVGSGNGGELFFTQFSFLGFDPRGRRDRYTNYARNNRAIALINRAYCMENPRGHAGYGADCWGLSAGINGGGGRPLPRDDNGTLNVMASLGAMPWTPEESLAALKHFYRGLGSKIWGVYGFHDGFNASQGWYEEVYMGLNQAPIVVMIENHRTGLLWKHFMANAEIPRALEAIGFEPDDR